MWSQPTIFITPNVWRKIPGHLPKRLLQESCTTDHREDGLKQFELLNRHKVCDRPGSKEEYPLLNVKFFENEDAALLQGAEYKVMRTSLRKRMRPKACSL